MSSQKSTISPTTPQTTSISAPDPGRAPTDFGDVQRSPPRGARTLLLISILMLGAVAVGFCYQRLKPRASTLAPHNDLNTVTSGIANRLTPPTLRSVEHPPEPVTPLSHSKSTSVDIPPAPQLVPVTLESAAGLSWLEPDPVRTDPVLERRLSSPLQTRPSHATDNTTSASQTWPSSSTPTPGGSLDESTATRNRTTLRATTLPDRNFLLTRGTLIDCVLQTRLISTQAGLVTCLTSHDVMSASGKVILIDRGSRLTGQQSGVLEHGQARILIAWDRLETPTGVIVNLEATATGALGEAGVSGEIDSHGLQRFGHAVLASFLVDVGQWARRTKPTHQRSSQHFSPDMDRVLERSASVADSILEKNFDIPPTLYKNQGERVGMMVTQDLDFSQVYELKPLTLNRRDE